MRNRKTFFTTLLVPCSEIEAPDDGGSSLQAPAEKRNPSNRRFATPRFNRYLRCFSARFAHFPTGLTHPMKGHGRISEISPVIFSENGSS